MSDKLWSEAGTPRMAWQACERCHRMAWQACGRCRRVFCFTPARFLPRPIDWQHPTVVEFEFVCLECLPDTTDAAAWGDWQRRAGNAG
jgi:hypothetical protein